MKLVLLQTLSFFAILWVSVAPNHRGAVIYGLSQAEAQGLPLKSGLTKDLWLAASTITTPPPAADSFYLGGGSENPRPCMRARNNKAYNIFKHRHVLSDTPSTQDTCDWKRFLHKHNLCDPNRTTQSFLQSKDESLINKVCNPEGGKIYKENLCISNRNFFFITVKIDSNCNILKITNKTEHIILACDTIDDVCRPVHFHGSQRKGKPMAPLCSNHRSASGTS